MRRGLIIGGAVLLVWAAAAFALKGNAQAEVECKAKVVVVPLSGAKGDATPADVLKGKTFSNSTRKGLIGTFVCPAGLTECDSSCVDTKNNPDYCGDCATACDDFSYCLSGSCVPRGCTTDAHCSTGDCVNNKCTLTKIVFLSSAKYTGNLGGIAGADAKCQGLATAAGFSGTFKAWLSIDGTVNPKNTFNHHDGSYVLPNGEEVAVNWDDLVDGILNKAINIFENGGNGGVWDNNTWTNTRIDGNADFADMNCDSWTSGYDWDFATAGSSYKLEDEWTDHWVMKCDQSKRLYCFEQ